MGSVFHSRNIKQCLIESLAYFRSVAVETIQTTHCPHKGHFDNSDPRCWDCRWEPECRWVTSHDECPNLSEKSAGELIEMLGFAIDFVECGRDRHHRNECECRTCSWLRETRHLLRRFSRQYPVSRSGRSSKVWSNQPMGLKSGSAC